MRANTLNTSQMGGCLKKTQLFCITRKYRTCETNSYLYRFPNSPSIYFLQLSIMLLFFNQQWKNPIFQDNRIFFSILKYIAGTCVIKSDYVFLSNNHLPKKSILACATKTSLRRGLPQTDLTSALLSWAFKEAFV